MAESDSSWQGQGGVDLDSLHCTGKLYTLLALFLASQPISELSEGHEFGAIHRTIEEHERTLIVHLLIECAILVRIMIEQYPKLRGGPTPESEVGLLEDLSRQSPAEPLSLRESCNKIVHAKTLNFDEEPDDRAPIKFLNPVLFLYGKKGKQEWRARIDIKNWVCAGVKLAF
jgi:hypothetical protein